jgi:hypothetical protein
VRGRPLGVLAAGLLAVEALLAVVGVGWSALSVVALTVAPGLALLPLLPARARESPTAALAAAPALGIAAASIALITVAAVGVELGPVSVRLTLAAVVVAGLAVPMPEPLLRGERAELLTGLGLLAALVGALLIQRRVIGDTPLPGNDWAKYLLYASQVEREGSLLIDNPFWMLGVPFREDPGVPALYGAFLFMTGQPAAVLEQGIGLFALAQVLSMFALARAVWGRFPALVAAGLWAALPINYTLLGWHGLANAAALVLLPLLLLYVTALIADELDMRAAAGLALTAVGLAASHRLSLAVGAATGALVLLAGLVLTRDRRSFARALARTGAFAALLAPGVAYDLITRGRTFGGTQDYTAYLATKVDFDLLLRDLTTPFAAAAALALVAVVVRRRGLRLVIPVVALLAVVAGFAHAWVLELPLHYTRMAYYLPVALVLLVAAAVAAWPRAGLAPAAGLVLAVVTGVAAWGQSDDVRRFYQFADAGSLRGLAHLKAALEPREVVVTDRCWSFLGTWLLQTRTLPALYPVDIQPKAELPFARAARAILEDRPRGPALVRRYGIRYAIVDPTCGSAEGPVEPVRIGPPVFVSQRLVVVRIRYR